MSKRVFLTALALMLLAALPAWPQAQKGFVYHDVQVVDELGRKVTGVTSFNIYLPDTTTNPVIYTYRDLAKAITLPMTTSSTNTTLVEGRCSWWGPDGWDYTLTDGVRTINNVSGPALDQSVTQLVLPTWLGVASSTSYTDVQSITMGGDGDFVLNAGTVANRMTVTPAADASTLYIGNGTASTDVYIFGSAASVYALFDEGLDSLLMKHYDVNMNDDSRLYFGTGHDWYVQSGTAKMLDFIPATSDESSAVRIGANSAGADLYLYGAASGDYAHFDASGNVLLMEDINVALGDGTKLLFGDDLGTGDFSISDESDVLTFAQIVEDTGTVAWGADDAGIDQTWYGESASAYMKWDATGADQLILHGVDSSGTLLAIAGIDATGNSDTVTIAHKGTGDALQITCTDATSVGLNLVGAAAQTTSILKVDGATGADWRGATGIGMVSLLNDGTPTHANATLLRIAQSGTSASGQRGIAASLEDTSTSGGATPYVFYISSTNNEAIWVDSGKVLVDETIFSSGGVQSGSVAVTADIEASQVTIPAGARFVTITSDTATKVVCLPAPVVGNMIEIYCAATGCELQTLAASNDTINAVDCDGGNELAIAATVLYRLVCVADSVWVATAVDANGAAVATLVPDADS